jgi:hypothetical protein
MLLSGAGISPAINIYIQPDFKPITEIALQWVKLSNGNYQATDRGSSSDVFQSEITLSGVESTIQTILAQIQLNRDYASGHVLTLSNFNSGEKIFGADIDYSGNIDVTVLKLKRKKQRSWKGFSVTLTLQAINPIFVGTASLPTLKPEVGYNGDAIFDVDKRDSYTGNFYYSDNDKDIGTFTAIYHLTDLDMMALRRYILTQRGSTISFPAMPGIQYAWGRRVTTNPFNAKIIEWDDLGLITWGIGSEVRCWGIKMTLAEVR